MQTGFFWFVYLFLSHVNNIIIIHPCIYCVQVCKQCAQWRSLFGRILYVDRRMIPYSNKWCVIIYYFILFCSVWIINRTRYSFWDLFVLLITINQMTFPTAWNNGITNKTRVYVMLIRCVNVRFPIEEKKIVSI